MEDAQMTTFNHLMLNIEKMEPAHRQKNFGILGDPKLGLRYLAS